MLAGMPAAGGCCNLPCKPSPHCLNGPANALSARCPCRCCAIADPAALAALMTDHTALDWRPLLPRITIPCLNIGAPARAVRGAAGLALLPGSSLFVGQCTACGDGAKPLLRALLASLPALTYTLPPLLVPPACTPPLPAVGRRSAVFPWYGCEVVGKLIPNCHTVRCPLPACRCFSRPPTTGCTWKSPRSSTGWWATLRPPDSCTPPPW